MLDSIHDRLYKSKNQNDTQYDYPIHQVQENEGINWIVLDDGLVHNATNSYFEQIPQPNGDIYLRLVDIFSSKNKSPPQLSQQADDQTEGLHHHV